MLTHLERAGLVLLGAATLLLYGTRLEHTPIYLFNAEALFGLQAHAIATTGHDINGRLLPVYFQMAPIGENVWFHPAIVYLTAAFLAVLPFAEWSVRLPSAFVGTADVILVYFVARRIFGRRRDAWLAAVLLALTPSHFIHSRIAMDYLHPVPFVLGWLLALLVFLEQRRPWLLFVATSLLGLGVYTYIASVIMMPLYLAFTLVALWWSSLLDRRTAAITVGGFAWPLLAIPIWLGVHPAVVTETLVRYRSSGEVTGIARVARRFSLFWSFWDPTYLFLIGGYANVPNSTRHAAVFALPLILPFLAGVRRLASRRRSLVDVLVLAGLFSAPVAACLVTPEPYAVDRELALLPFGVLAIVAGARALAESPRLMWRRAGVAAIALVPIHFAFFYYDYFTDYRRHSAAWFELNRRGAMETLVSMTERSLPPRIYLPADRDPYIETYWRFTLTKLKHLELRDRTVMYHSDGLRTMEIPAGSLVLARSWDTPVTALVAAGHLRQRAVIEELADPPEFFVLER